MFAALSNLKAWLDGKTTYITGAATILTTIAGWAHGDVGFIHALIVILGVISAMRLRAGIQKAQDAASANVTPTNIIVHPGATLNNFTGQPVTVGDPSRIGSGDILPNP